MRPISLKPQAGAGWFAKEKPARQRATYNRRHGTRNHTDYNDWTEFSKAAQAYIRRRNRDPHDPRIIELENRRKVAWVTGGTIRAAALEGRSVRGSLRFGRLPSST